MSATSINLYIIIGHPPYWLWRYGSSMNAINMFSITIYWIYKCRPPQKMRILLLSATQHIDCEDMANECNKYVKDSHIFVIKISAIYWIYKSRPPQKMRILLSATQHIDCEDMANECNKYVKDSHIFIIQISATLKKIVYYYRPRQILIKRIWPNNQYEYHEQQRPIQLMKILSTAIAPSINTFRGIGNAIY
jgi:hypothetical protein